MFAVVAAILIFEIALRVAGVSYPTFFMLDPYHGFSPRPGVEGWFRQEGEAYVRIKRHGLRDWEALQVPLEQTASAILEGMLQHCPRSVAERSR